jgi:Mannosylglycerate hydrolase MGH1-like glycoside hydrolase domain
MPRQIAPIPIFRYAMLGGCPVKDAPAKDASYEGMKHASDLCLSKYHSHLREMKMPIISMCGALNTVFKKTAFFLRHDWRNAVYGHSLNSSFEANDQRGIHVRAQNRNRGFTGGSSRNRSTSTSSGLFPFAAISILCSVAGASKENRQEIPCDEPQVEQGSFYEKKVYVPTLLPKFVDVKDQLPSPILDDKKTWIEMYWKAWELAFKNLHEPAPQSGFVSQYIDASFSDNIYLWDSSFITMFCNEASALIPCISTLDNFYARQHADGEICREIERNTGKCWYPWINRECKSLASRFGWSGQRFTKQESTLPLVLQNRANPVRNPMFEQVGTLDNPFLGWLELETERGRSDDGQIREDLPDSSEVTYIHKLAPQPNPIFTLEALDNPILAWAELESYRTTGDTGRLARVWEPLVRYYSALRRFLTQGNGLYMTDFASMDNSPRNHYLEGGGTAIDTSSQQVLFARNLAEIAAILGKKEESQRYVREADTLAGTINRLLWDTRLGFYFDLTLSGQRVPVKTAAAYWTLLGRVASPRQARKLVSQLRNPLTFGRLNPIPTLAADEPLYDSAGGYWRGAVWAPTNAMVIRGLEMYGFDEFARQLALRYLEMLATVYKSTGTIWENYAPDKPEQGNVSRPDFVGWSGIGPILYLIEYGIGLKPDAARNELLWNLEPNGRQGCKRYRFNGHITSLVAEPITDSGSKRRIIVESDANFVLKIVYNRISKIQQIKAGRQQFTIG